MEGVDGVRIELEGERDEVEGKDGQSRKGWIGERGKKGKGGGGRKGDGRTETKGGRDWVR